MLRGYGRLVYDFFKDLIDPATNRPFFCADHEKRYRNEMGYVLNGDLSDPPGMNMYSRRTHQFLALVRSPPHIISSDLRLIRSIAIASSGTSSSRCSRRPAS